MEPAKPIELGRLDEKVAIPFEIAEAHRDGAIPIPAWRVRLKLTQDEAAKRRGVTRPAFAQMEASGAHPRLATLHKIAAVMGVEWEQLREEAFCPDTDRSVAMAFRPMFQT